MGQVTIYLDDDTERRMIQNAQKLGVSKSKWISTVIREKLVESWPLSVQEAAGTWCDFPEAEELRAGDAADTPRESF
jgi:predicted transcriptional regulator